MLKIEEMVSKAIVLIQDPGISLSHLAEIGLQAKIDANMVEV